MPPVCRLRAGRASCARQADARARLQVPQILHAGRQGARRAPPPARPAGTQPAVAAAGLTGAGGARQHPDLIEKRRKLYADRIRRYMPGVAADRPPPAPRHPAPPQADVRRRNTGP